MNGCWCGRGRWPENIFIVLKWKGAKQHGFLIISNSFFWSN